MDVRLRWGIDAQLALDRINGLKIEAMNLISGAAGLGAEQRRDAYLIWVEKAEPQLRHLFASDAIWEGLLSSRWNIRDMSAPTPRPSPLIGMEAQRQVENLERLEAALKNMQQILTLPADYTAIMLDTSVLIHYRRFDEIKWAQLAGASTARLLIPLIVIDELDDHSFKSRPLSARASGVLKSLRRYRGDQPPELPLNIRPDVELQFVMDPPGHQRRGNYDEEFLIRAEHVAGIVGALSANNRVLVATGDFGMELRANLRGFRYLRLPDESRLSLKDESLEL